MPRPSGGGLKFWSFDVGLFRDKKIRQIKGEFGLKGVMIFLYVLNAIYETNGYFLKWDDDDCYLMSEDVGDGCSASLIKKVIERCFRRSLFDERIFDVLGVLTSESIQRRYLIGVQKNRNAITIIKEYWLLNDENPSDVPPGILKKIIFISQSRTENAVNRTENTQNRSENATNKTIQNKTIQNKTKPNQLPPFVPAELREAWSAFVEHRKKLKKPMSDFSKKLNYDELMKLSDGDFEKAKRIIEQSVKKGWQGFFELEERNNLYGRKRGGTVKKPTEFKYGETLGD